MVRIAPVLHLFRPLFFVIVAIIIYEVGHVLNNVLDSVLLGFRPNVAYILDRIIPHSVIGVPNPHMERDADIVSYDTRKG